MRRVVLGVLLVTSVVAGCARPVPAPVVTTPRYPGYIFPTLSQPDPKLAELLRQHDRGWGWLQAGDLTVAEREFQAVLKRSPEFYPTLTQRTEVPRSVYGKITWRF